MQRTDLPSRFDTARLFAQRAEAVNLQPPFSPARQQLEADLVAAYVATLPHRYLCEHPVGELRADVYEPTVRRIVEAEAAADVVTVAHAWAHAAAYRYAANSSALDDRTTVESIAVLLPAAPTWTARSFLELVAADCFEVELIYPHGETFRHEQLTWPERRQRSGQLRERLPARRGPLADRCPKQGHHDQPDRSTRLRCFTNTDRASPARESASPSGAADVLAYDARAPGNGPHRSPHGRLETPPQLHPRLLYLTNRIAGSLPETRDSASDNTLICDEPAERHAAAQRGAGKGGLRNLP